MSILITHVLVAVVVAITIKYHHYHFFSSSPTMFQHFNMIAIIIIISCSSSSSSMIVVVVVVPDIVSRHRSGCCRVTTPCSVVGIVAKDGWYRATHKCRAAPVVVSMAQDPCWTGEGGGRPTAVSTGRSISE